MKFYLLMNIIAFLISLTKTKNQSLQLVHVFFRHGSRTPELKDIYPTDPYTSATFAPMGYGALTNAGKQSSFKLGQLLRQRYASFLGEIYTPEIVEGWSTDYDRTKMTVLLVLAGLFPPPAVQKWENSLSWQPIPYHYDRDHYDYTLRRPTWYCPMYVKELAEVLASEDAHRVIKANKNLFKYLEKHVKKPINKLLDVFGIYQTLTAEDFMNLTLPTWTRSVFPDRIHDIASKLVNFENYNSVLKKLNGGRMLGKIIEHMAEKANNSLLPLGRKIYLYSGHENNIINILAALNMFEPHIPRYSAAVIVELHLSNFTNEYGVKVFYVRDENTEPEVQRLEGCDTLCPLNDFIRITQPHVPVNYTAECQSQVNLD